MIIITDIDSVLNNLYTTWFKYHNSLHNDNLDESMVTDWDLTSLSTCGDCIYTLLEKAEVYTEQLPRPLSQKVINRWIKDKHEVHAATTVAGPISATAKHQWLKQHYGIPMITIKDKHLLNGDILIDDGLHNLESFTGIRLLFEQNSNKLHHKDRYPIVKDWADVNGAVYFITTRKQLGKKKKYSRDQIEAELRLIGYK